MPTSAARRAAPGFENLIRLWCAGMSLDNLVFSVEPLNPDETRYVVPPGASLETNPDRSQWLVWTSLPDESDGPMSPPSGNYLVQFLRLANADSARMVSFARRWGFLGEDCIKGAVSPGENRVWSEIASNDLHAEITQ